MVFWLRWWYSEGCKVIKINPDLLLRKTRTSISYTILAGALTLRNKNKDLSQK